MNKEKELAVNTLIIFIGRFCTQFVSFLLIPIYTHFLITSDYGYVDLIQTYISLIAPILILRFDSAIFRFLIDCRKNEEYKSEVISSSLSLIIIQIIVAIVIFVPISIIFNLNYSIAILLNIVFVSISSYLLQLTRGIGKNIDYSVGSIISAIIMILLNSVLIIKYKFNASSILYASACANVFCSVYLVLKNKLLKYFKITKINKNKLKEMLKYSLPMIPDGLSWWILNVSDRTIITIFINTAANGIYAVASKFSNILSSLFQVFNMSWQESASIHIEEKDRNEFFTNILNKTYLLFFSICITLLVGMPFIFSLFVGKEYQKAYIYIPILLLGNLFNSIANTVGGVYIAKKETKKVAKTTIIAAVLNIIINVVLIKRIGLYAAAISTLISYIIIAAYRYVDVKKYVDMKLNYKVFGPTIALFCLSSILYYLNNIYINFVNLIIIIMIVLFINKKYIGMIFKKIKER